MADEGIRVVWSMFGSEAPFELIVAETETEMPFWVERRDSAIDAVNAISIGYFGDAVWERLFGLELVEAEVLFQIAAPANMAGAYEVALRRVTTAECKRVRDPRLMDAAHHSNWLGSLALESLE